MHREKKEKHFIKKPVYPGGNPAMKKFIRENMVYPAEAKKNRIEGTVRVHYTINYKGKVIETQVISKLGYGCDEEAERLVSLLQFKVEKPKGIKVKFHKDINIHFRLPKQEEVKINYEITPKKMKKVAAPGKSGSGSIEIVVEV